MNSPLVACLPRRFAFAATLALVLTSSFAVLAQPAEGNANYLAYLMDEHVGTWATRVDGTTYQETLRIVSAQEKGRTTVIESFALSPEGTGWRWERKLRAGPIDRIERGTLVDGRLWRENDAGQAVASIKVPEAMVLPSMRAERIRAFARRANGNTAATPPTPATGEAIAYLDPSRLRPVRAWLENCAVDAALPGAAHCVKLRLDARSGDEAWQLAGDGRVLRIDMAFGGMPLRLDPCTRDCDRPVAHPFDMIDSMAVASPIRIQQRYSRLPMRYVLSRADGKLPVFAITGEQEVASDGDRAVVTVCRECGKAVAETAQSLAPYLRANAWVRSDDAAVRRIAAKAGSAERSIPARMASLESKVRQHMHRDADYVGYADAAEALRTGKGDCTEFAVLLAALARAQGIPARVVVGMAYSARFTGNRDSFNPHAWVQVYDGQRWRSYDAALEGFDSAHVALAVGTGEPQELFDAFLQLRQLRIDKLDPVQP
ncbi:MAG: transglutaminase-like domain-containing protein [Arenimonas sp.]